MFDDATEAICIHDDRFVSSEIGARLKSIVSEKIQFFHVELLSPKLHSTTCSFVKNRAN